LATDHKVHQQRVVASVQNHKPTRHLMMNGLCEELMIAGLMISLVSGLDKNRLGTLRLPSLSLYRRSTVTFNTIALCPFFAVISFSQIAAEICPALNFATGVCPAIFSPPRASRQDAIGSLSDD